MDVKSGIFLTLEKSGLSSCAVGKLQWGFLSLCRACALQKVHLSPFLPQGHQVHPGTRGCSEAGGAGIGAMGVSTFAWCGDSECSAEAGGARWLMLPPVSLQRVISLCPTLFKCPQLTPILGMDLSSMHRLPGCPHRALTGLSMRTHHKQDLRS